MLALPDQHPSFYFEYRDASKTTPHRRADGSGHVVWLTAAPRPFPPSAPQTVQQIARQREGRAVNLRRVVTGIDAGGAKPRLQCTQ